MKLVITFMITCSQIKPVNKSLIDTTVYPFIQEINSIEYQKNEFFTEEMIENRTEEEKKK